MSGEDGASSEWKESPEYESSVFSACFSAAEEADSRALLLSSCWAKTLGFFGSAGFGASIAFGAGAGFDAADAFAASAVAALAASAAFGAAAAGSAGFSAAVFSSSAIKTVESASIDLLASSCCAKALGFFGSAGFGASIAFGAGAGFGAADAGFAASAAFGFGAAAAGAAGFSGAASSVAFSFPPRIETLLHQGLASRKLVLDFMDANLSDKKRPVRTR